MSIAAAAIASAAIGASPSAGAGADLPITLPLRLEVTASPAISLALRLNIGETGAAKTAPLRLDVIDDAFLGGLDGSGGWPSAPTGRWRPFVTLGGDDISDRLVGQIIVRHADDEARTAEFSFRPISVLQPMQLVGRRVQIYFAQRGASGEAQAAQCLFTGVLETPSVDLQTGLISCTCHDQLQEVISNTSREWIDLNVGGRWRVEISGEPADNWDYMVERRESVPSSVVLDAYQSPRVIAWRNALVQETVQEADILDGSLSVDLPSRDELRTRIRVRLQYRFERLRGRGAVASYSQPISFFIVPPSKLWLTTAMVKGSAEGLRGWELQSLNIEHPAPGGYLLGPAPEDGTYIIPANVAPDLALGFQARYAARWTQSLTEDYTVDVVLPDLESSLGGPISEEIGATMDVPFDVRDWGVDPSVEPVLSIPLAGDVISAWKPVGSQSTDRDEVLLTLLDRAWVRLWGASRSGRVRFELPLRPNLWLDNEVTVEASTLNARGKVVEVEHRMDMESGEAITAVALAVGLPGDEDASLPSWTLPAAPAPDDDREPDAFSFEVQTYVGGEILSPVFDEETMIGFATNVENPNVLAENFYPHQLSIKAPDIEAIDRDPLVLEAAAVINTTIPTDLLEMT